MKSLIYNTKCALYVRVSSEEKNEHRHSIETQMKVLNKYVKDHQLQVIDYYIDEGISGTTFERPSYLKMLEDIKYKKINCIIIKDLSRLGRNHLYVGNLIENLFPKQDIRLISINDGLDTANGFDELIPIRNLMNEWYSKDISKKIKASLHKKATNGRVSPTIGGFYGYKYEENSKNLIIDEEPAKIIRLIFQEFLSGNSTNNIAKNITSMHVATPGFYRYLNYNYKAGYHGKSEIEKKYIWSNDMVRKILKKFEYTGNTINLKTYRIRGKQVKTPQELQKVVMNTHPAIISLEEFEKAQTLFKKSNHLNRSKEELEQTFQGLVVNDSNHIMTYRVRRGYAEYAARNGKNYCIRADHLKELVEQEVKSFMDAIIKNPEQTFEILSRSSIYSYDVKEEKGLLEQKQSLVSKGAVLFRKKVSKQINSDQYTSQMKIIDSQIDDIEKKLSSLLINKINKSNLNASFQLFVSTVKKNLSKNIFELSKFLIHKIMVYKNENKFIVKIYYKYLNSY